MCQNIKLFAILRLNFLIMKKAQEVIVYLKPRKKIMRKSTPKKKKKALRSLQLAAWNITQKNIAGKLLLLLTGVLSASLLAIILMIGAIYFFIQTHEEFAANLADYTLRPIIGSQATVSLEAAFFNLQDKFNQLQYLFNKSSDSVIADTKVPPFPTIQPVDTAFTLKPIPPILTDSKLPGEGIWTSFVGSDEAVMGKTVFRPDPERPYAVVTLVKMDMNKLSLGSVAGLREPGGPQNPGPGMVPMDIQNSNHLLAAFDGGFQGKDGYYGMVVGNKEYLPLQKNLATFVIHRNHKPEILRFSGKNIGDDVLVARQNGPLLIEDSQIVATSSAWDTQTWGLTTTNSMYTWRSGAGITKEGDLIYASGPSLIPETLSVALKAAGSVNAMQLDINPVWVRFVIFHSLENGQYSFDPLTQDMVNGGYEYLHGYQKDFFYVYRKT